MKYIFSVLKDGINAIKKQKSVRGAVIVLWVANLSYYVMNMLSPLIQSALLDGATTLFSNMPNYGLIFIGCAGILVINTVTGLRFIKTNYLHQKASDEIYIAIQSKIYDKLCKIPYSSFSSPKIYETISLVSDRYASYCSDYLVGQTLTSIVGTIISFVFTSIVLINVSPVVAIIMICGNLFGVFKTWLESRLNYYTVVDKMKDRRYAESYSSTLFDKNTVKEIKTYNLTDYICRKWYKYTARVNRKTIGYNILFMLLDFVTYFTANLFTVAALILTSRMILEGSLGIGAFALVYSSSGALIDKSGSLLNSIRDLKSASYFVKKYNEFNAIPDIEPEHEKSPSAKRERSVDPLQIKFKDVSFTYEGSEQKAICNLNLTINQGEKVAIVGENGCGKSTLVALLNRLYAPDEGEILISGLPQNEQLPKLRREVTTIFQDFGCYETTFRENIVMADKSREYSDNYLWKCAHQTGIDTRIMQSKDGMDTPIGPYAQGGINLSGGEWQKLAITRGLARKDSKMLIMDEPNASLDPISEAEIYKRVFDAMQGETLVLITHRLGAVKYVDRIIVMDHGEIVEDGTHDALMKAGGKYSKMYTSQAKWYEQSNT